VKRFYSHVDITELPEKGFGLMLDGKPVKTPRGNILFGATESLAEHIAEEWRRQNEEINPETMPITQFCNAACDITPEEREHIIAHVINYAETDTLCYREPENTDLQRKQHEQWEPLLRWAEMRYQVTFVRVEGIMPSMQDENTLVILRHVVQAMPNDKLVAINELVSLTGSLVLGLAVHERQLNAAQAFELSILEYLHNKEKWGADEEAEAAVNRKRDSAIAAGSYLATIDS
jgi:chaperone required for assembly of F1-ATPase